jgi:hypothetical protein
MSDTGTSSPKIRIIHTARTSNEIETAVEGDESTRTVTARTIPQNQGANALASVINIERLWEAPSGTSSQMVRALELLKDVSDLLADALRAQDPMDADRMVPRVQTALPKLFACRSIGDGFAVIVNSLHFAFQNLHGIPLSQSQLNVVWRLTRELRVRPVMSLEQGIQRVEELEEHGLQVDPPDIAALLEETELGE